jgi:cytochrome c5
MWQLSIRTIFSVVLAGTMAFAAGCAPAIPHTVVSRDRVTCLSCHVDGSQGAPKTSHAERQDCLECHRPSR